MAFGRITLLPALLALLAGSPVMAASAASNDPAAKDAKGAEAKASAPVEPTATVSWGARTATSTPPVEVAMTPLGTVPQPTAEGPNGAYYAGYVGSQIFDLATTGLAIGRGAVEGNPLMRLAGAAGPGGILVKAVTTWGVTTLIKRISRKHPKLAAATLTGLSAATVAAGAKNLSTHAALR
jgi:hypothetical protein